MFSQNKALLLLSPCKRIKKLYTCTLGMKLSWTSNLNVGKYIFRRPFERKPFVGRISEIPWRKTLVRNVGKNILSYMFRFWLTKISHQRTCRIINWIGVKYCWAAFYRHCTKRHRFLSQKNLIPFFPFKAARHCLSVGEYSTSYCKGRQFNRGGMSEFQKTSEYNICCRMILKHSSCFCSNKLSFLVDFKWDWFK